MVSVTADTALTGGEFYAFAGGLAGSVRNAENVEITGTGSVAASGGASVAAGGVALLGEDMSFAVITGVTVSADVVGWAVGVASQREDGYLSNLFATIGTASGALVAVMENGASMEHCRYLYGEATLSNVTTEQVTDVEKLTSSEAFYDVALYADLDSEIWSIDGASIPSLK